MIFVFLFEHIAKWDYYKQSVCTVFPNIWAVILPLWSYVLPIKPKDPLLLFPTGQVFQEVILCVCLVGTCQGVLLFCCVKSRPKVLWPMFLSHDFTTALILNAQHTQCEHIVLCTPSCPTISIDAAWNTWFGSDIIVCSEQWCFYCTLQSFLLLHKQRFNYTKQRLDFSVIPQPVSSKLR